MGTTVNTEQMLYLLGRMADENAGVTVTNPYGERITATTTVRGQFITNDGQTLDDALRGLIHWGLTKLK